MQLALSMSSVVLLLLNASVITPGLAQSVSSVCVDSRRQDARPVQVSITAANLERSAGTGITGAGLFLEFRSAYGFVYRTMGLPLIGAHNPFVEAVPDRIRVSEYGPDTSINSVIIPERPTEYAGSITLHGISGRASALILLGLSVLGGIVAVLAKDLIAATALGGSEDLMNHLFLAGFFTAFFAGVFVIDDLSDAFGENEPVYFDNASDAAYRLIVNGQTATSIGAGEHMQVWMGLGWNDLAAHPTTGDGPVWCGRILVEDSPGYLVFNVGGQNSYTVMTAAWGE